MTFLVYGFSVALFAGALGWFIGMEDVRRDDELLDDLARAVSDEDAWDRWLVKLAEALRDGQA